MIEIGSHVEHAEFGIGKVVSVLGDVATVEFFGDALDVALHELLLRPLPNRPLPPQGAQVATDPAFRKIFEAVNLGVVPRDPDQLIDLTIGGATISEDIAAALRSASTKGLCRVFMGYYGSGKSHHLQLVQSVALRDGWVTASIELDPKAADPAKPSTVYQELISGLTFPARADGTRNKDFFDLIKEIRDNWARIRDLPYFKRAPWFSQGVAALLYLTHRRDDPKYVSAVNWLAGQVKLISVMRSLSWRLDYRNEIPALPQMKDTGLVYAYLLTVLNEVVRALGYRGLTLIFDEAEHVRSYSLNRYLRANNFFDILARCAHAPRHDLKTPESDYDFYNLPSFWKEGPHFALFVGLTEGEDVQDLKRKAGEMSVLIHEPSDVVRLTPPNEADYERWTLSFISRCADRLGPKIQLLRDPQVRSRVSSKLREHFERTPTAERILRNWTKMAGFAPAVLLSDSREMSSDELINVVEYAARDVAGETLPWDS